MSAGARIPLDDALPIAAAIAEALAPGCERIEIAGSIRRRRADVGDIEILAIPRIHTEQIADGLFDTRDVAIDELQLSLDLALADGLLASHPLDPKRGPKYAKLVHAGSGIQVDLFSTRPETWGVAFLIRTGPAEYSERFVTEIKRRNWHIGRGCELHVGGLKCDDRMSPCEAVATPDEADVARLTGWHLVPPAMRA
jgi:DNA polymerase/3'-5' exonuclease PolX